LGLPSDLLLAATAEFHDLTVLHYDADFESIASATGQPTEWIAPRGSVS
jgi:predicted nucleic acid-binding protein